MKMWSVPSALQAFAFHPVIIFLQNHSSHKWSLAKSSNHQIIKKTLGIIRRTSTSAITCQEKSAYIRNISRWRQTDPPPPAAPPRAPPPGPPGPPIGGPGPSLAPRRWGGKFAGKGWEGLEVTWVWVNTYSHPFWVGWTSIYQYLPAMTWGSHSVPGFWPIPTWGKMGKRWERWAFDARLWSRPPDQASVMSHDA